MVPGTSGSCFYHVLLDPQIKKCESGFRKEDAPVFAKMPTEQELRRKELVSSQPSSSIHIFLNDSIRIEICPSCPSELLSAIIKELRHHA
ncbi:hypothetical protein NIA73_07255 [Anaerobutyricum hallii]|nr:hypothetical protein [Anaerobutyricum hallii]